MPTKTKSKNKPKPISRSKAKPARISKKPPVKLIRSYSDIKAIKVFHMIPVWAVIAILILGVGGLSYYFYRNYGDSRAATVITNSPTQPAALMYGGNENAGLVYGQPGGLVVAGRDNYQNQAFKTISANGGTVLIYLDVMIDGSTGRYHQLLVNASECGPAVARWPGLSAKANVYGFLTDFRVGSILQNKLECVLEKMVAENQHMAGWFADDLGSRSYYPGCNPLATPSNGVSCASPLTAQYDWNSWTSVNKQAYRDGAIAASQTFRKVANKYGLMVIVNGTWNGGDISSAGGGYPNAAVSGNSLSDGGFVEHHDGQQSYFVPYACSAQWASQSPLTNGKPFMYEVSYTASDRSAYANSKCSDGRAAYAYAQIGDYSNAPIPWTAFHPTGLPTRVSGVTTPTPTPIPTPTPTPTPTPSPTPSPSPVSQTPFNAVKTIPGLIQAEDFDNGGEGISFHDTNVANQGNQYRQTGVDIELSKDAGNSPSIGWVAPGEWLEYTTNTAVGTYDFKARVTSALNGTSMTIKLDGATLATAQVPNTGGWYNWQDITVKNIPIPAGSSKVLRVEFNNTFNLNYFSFVKQVAAPPTGSTAPPVVVAPPTGSGGGSTGSQTTTVVDAVKPGDLVAKPLVAIPGSAQNTSVKIPSTLPAVADNTYLADFNGDGHNDLALDANGDGNIDTNTEIISTPDQQFSSKPLSQTKKKGIGSVLGMGGITGSYSFVIASTPVKIPKLIILIPILIIVSGGAYFGWVYTKLYATKKRIIKGQK